jgi:hypothetical protein
MVVMGALPLPCPTIPFLQSLPASDAPYVDSSGSACRPPSPSPPGAASICGALRNAHTATPPPSVGNGMEPVVDFLPHRHTSSRFVRPASTTTPRWCALRFFGFGSRVQSIKRQHTGRERRTYPFVRHCLVSSCVQALPRTKGCGGSVVPIQAHRPDPVPDSYAYVVRGCVHLSPLFSSPDHYTWILFALPTIELNEFL